MKIAVSAKGEALDSEVDPRFGGSSGFVLFDTDTGNADYLDNSTQRHLSQGTGVQKAKMIAEAGAETLITGQLGPKAARVLDKSGIKIYLCRRGNVRQALQALEADSLNELSGEAIQPGPGKMGGRGIKGGGRGRGRSQSKQDEQI
jgi:predicted Fe-Mo cluster-binding NifX family protein